MSGSNSLKQNKTKIKPAGISISKILESPIQLIFMLSIIISIVMLIPFTMAGIRSINKSINGKPENYKWPQVTDLYVTVISAGVLAVLKKLCVSICYPMFLTICKEQDDENMRDQRSMKGAIHIYKTLYFIVSTTCGFMILKDQSWFPHYLGGNGTITATFKDYPYPKQDQRVNLYILINQGYHLCSLIEHFLVTRRNDFVEMALHHIVTIYLFTGCYLMNCKEIGAVIAFLHDIADITTPLTKSFAESKFKIQTIFVFFTNLIIWALTRNVVFPWIIYNIIYNISDDFNGEPFMRPFFAYLLSCLALLHFYWVFLMIQHLCSYINTDSTEDLHHTVQVDNNNKEKKG